MANPNNARGLIPVKHIDGSPYSGPGNLYHVPANYGTALYLGLPLIATGASDANAIPTVQIATAAGSNYTIGPMMGIADGGEPVTTVTRDMVTYHPASTLQYILVADDPNTVFEAQEDGLVTPIATATAGTKNVSLIAGAGSTTTGYSGWQLDSDTVATTALQIRLLRGVHRADNEMAALYSKWLCMINLHSLRNTTGV
mgnify:FL=1